MATRALTSDEILEILRTTVPRLEVITGGVPQGALYAVTGYGWSVNDQLAHLRSCQDVLGGNMLRIVREDRPAWKGNAPTSKQAEYFEWKFPRAFEAFREQRAELLEVLARLRPGAWGRTATVSVPPNKVYEYSVLYYGGWLARHERTHVKHMKRVLEEVRKDG